MSPCFLSVQDIQYRYEDGQEALRGASIHIQPGVRLAVVGANGAGKSSLLMALSSLIPALIGKAHFEGCALLTKSAKDLQKHFKSALLMQDPDHQLIAPSVLQDIMLGALAQGLCPQATELKARHLIDIFGMKGLELHPPHQLSLGQKKKTALAGLLICAPQLLLLDEPTAGLDGKGTRELLKLLASSLSPHAPVVMATHDQALVTSWADEVLVMDQGGTMDQVSISQFLQSPRLLEICGFEQNFEKDRSWKQAPANPFLSL